MKSQKFAYNARRGDNMKFAYTPKMEQKANFVYKELGDMASDGKIEKRKCYDVISIYRLLCNYDRV